MDFKEVERKPKFTLSLSLDEAIALWHIANHSLNNGNENAKIFVEALYDFAANSNSYIE